MSPLTLLYRSSRLGFPVPAPEGRQGPLGCLSPTYPVRGFSAIFAAGQGPRLLLLAVESARVPPYSARVIALDHTTVAVLREHRRRQRAEAAASGPGYQASGYVFTNRRGGPMAPDRLTRIFRALSEEAGLPPVRLHDLRHGAAPLALGAAVDLRTVQEMLGHSSIVLTADTYIRWCLNSPSTPLRRSPRSS